MWLGLSPSPPPSTCIDSVEIFFPPSIRRGGKKTCVTLVIHQKEPKIEKKTGIWDFFNGQQKKTDANRTASDWSVPGKKKRRLQVQCRLMMYWTSFFYIKSDSRESWPIDDKRGFSQLTSFGHTSLKKGTTTQSSQKFVWRVVLHAPDKKKKESIVFT